MKKLFIIFVIVLGTMMKISAQDPDAGRIFQALLEKKDTVVLKEGEKTIVVYLRNTSEQEKKVTHPEANNWKPITALALIALAIFLMSKRMPELGKINPDKSHENDLV